MRSMTAAQAAALVAAHRATRLRVLVDRGVGDWVDLSALEGRNWCQGAVWGDSEDSSVATVEVALFSRVENLSLAPLMDASKLNAGGTLLDLGNPIRIEVAVLTQDAAVSASDWVEAFRGEIDEIDWAEQLIRVRARDNSGRLDAFIETQSKRPWSLAVAPVEMVMQEILDDVFGTGVVVLYSINGTAAVPFLPADSPEWFIPEYVQQKQPVLQALRVLSDQIGWYVRQVWNDSVGAFVLTLYEPPRARAARGSLTFTDQPVAAETFVINATTCTARAAGAGADEFNIAPTVLGTCANIAAMLLSGTEAANIAGAWVGPGQCAVGSLTLTGLPLVGETFSVGWHTYTAVAAGAGASEFVIGATKEATAVNIAAAVNYMSSLQGVFAKAIAAAVLLQWHVPGSAGNAVNFTEAMTNTTADGGGWLGGTVLGTDGDVVIEWGTKGPAGNAVVFTEALSNCLADGGGFLGGTRLGANAGGDVYTFGPDRYFAPSRVGMSRAGIRNVVRVKFGVSQLDRTTVEVQDAASIAKYGRRWMEIAEDGSSQIDTEGEARMMADAVLGDLSEPEADLTVPVPFFWPVELTGDTYTFEANDTHFDTDQALAVVGYRHSLTPSAARTELTLRGKPSGGFKRWLELEARPGVAPQNSFYQGAAAEGVVATAGQGVVSVTYDDPRGMSPPINDWAFTNCYLDTVGGFTPSAANRVDVGRRLRFDICGLIPGETYYVKLQIIDGAGNVAMTTTQVSIAAEKTTAYHEDNDTLRMNLIPNGTFGQFVKGTSTPPDGWSVYAGVWGLDIYADDQSQEQSGYSVAMGPDGAEDDSGLVSDFIPCAELQAYLFSATTNCTAISANTVITFEAEYYDAAKTLIKTDSVYTSTSLTWIPAGSWQHPLHSFIPQTVAGVPHARYMRIRFFRSDAGAVGHVIRVDTVELTKQAAYFRAYRNAVQSINSGVFTRVEFNVGGYEILTRARGTLTLTGNPVAAETFVINATTCTARAAGAGADEFTIGATKEITAQNIVDMLRAGAEAANITAWREGALVRIEWNIAGAGGNAIVFTEALSNATADGGGTLGGTVLGGIVYGFDSTTNPGRFTALQPGEYAFAASVGLTSLADGNRAEMEFRVNGVAAGGGASLLMGGAGNVRLVGSMQYSLARGDYVEVFVQHDFGAARNTVAGTNETYFTGTRIASGG